MAKATDQSRDAPPQNRPDNGDHGPDGRFTTGNRANPGGRPSTQWIRDYLAEIANPKQAGSPSRRMAVVQALFLTAIERRHKDHVKAAELLMAYEAGKPIQAVEVSGPDQNPLETVQLMTSEQQKARLLELLSRALATAVPPAPDDGGGG
jgi:hypothetical protein